MLKDYDLDKSIAHTGRTRSVTFTTAEAELTQDMKAGGDFFAYRGMQEDNKALITRTFSGASMIAAEGKRLSVTDITLDGAKDSYSASENGGIVRIAGGGSLMVADGAALQNSTTTQNGGAVYVSLNASVTISGGTITGNLANGNGGAVYVAEGGSATVSGGTLNGNVAENGAGIYLAWVNASNHAVLYLSGNPSFGGTDRKGGNGNDKDDLKGTEGNFVRKNASFKTEDKEPTNGSKQYPKDGELYLVRQDIYIPGNVTPQNAHNAICVTGKITSGDGTIWVWAEHVNHYEMLKQFAVFSGNGISLSDADKESTMRVFRNAEPDGKTNCGGDYLTGQKGETVNWIYWSGGFDVVFMKTDSFGKALPGATFTLYTDEACTTPYVMTFTSAANVTRKTAASVSSNGTETYKDKDGNPVVLLRGEVLLSKLPPKTFYLKETQPSIGFDRDENKTTVYQVTVSDKGELTMKKRGTSGSYDTEIYKEKRREIVVDGHTIDVVQYVVMNIPTAERKTILRKVNETFEALDEAEFEILRYDRTVVSGTDINGTTGTTFVSGESGVYFCGTLPFGTYYVHETKNASGEAVDIWFILTVNADGAGYMQEGEPISQEMHQETTEP